MSRALFGISLWIATSLGANTAALAREAVPAGIPTSLRLLGHAVEYVIITDDDWTVSFQPLADWKTASGVPAVVQGLSAIRAEYPAATDDAERIRLFIRNAYQNWGTRWVLLGGDTEVLPVRYATTTFYGGWQLPTDLYFQCLGGSWNADGDGAWGEGYMSASNPGDDADLVPEVWLGRAPVRSPAEVSRFVSKTLQYEKTPAGDYEDRALCAAEVLFPTDWVPPLSPSLDGAELVEPLLPYYDLHPDLRVDRLYENDADPRWRPGALHETRSAVLDSFALGANLALLIGQGDVSGISTGDSRLVDGDMNALANGPRLLNLYCVTGQANAIDSSSIGESAMRASGGAVSCIGGTLFDFPTASRGFMQEFYRLLLQDGVTAIGEAFARSKSPFVSFSAYDGVIRWTEMSYLLLGDPELHIWLGRPCALEVHRPATLQFGDTAFTVTVARDGAPVGGARVTAYRAGEQLSIVTTDVSGVARVPYLADHPGDVSLTVIVAGCRPDVGTIQVSDPATPALASLVSVEVAPDRVRLVWSCVDCATTRATVLRRAPGSDEVGLAEVVADGTGRIEFIDSTVSGGGRFGYLLSLREGAIEIRTAETWVDVPAGLRLELSAAGSNPAQGVVELSLSLPDSRPARIEALDLSGRRRLSRDVGALGAGTHRIRLDGSERLPAGVYLVRLTHDGTSRVLRIAIVH